MDSSRWLRSELSRFDPACSTLAALTPRWTWYTDPRFLQLEREAVFLDSWQPVARQDQLRAAGDCYAGSLLGKPFVVVRGEDHQLRAFYNVCAHHAAEVASTGSGCQQFVCPYHGWQYDLAGQLVKAPGLGRQQNFDVADYRLQPIAVQQFGPLVFINFSSKPSDLHQQLAPLKTRLDELGFDDLQFVARREYTLQCNWKVFVDNYLDGGYHVSAVHPGLADQLNLEDYRTEVFERFSIQSCDAAKREQTSVGSQANGGGDFAERIGDGSIYAWLHPNFMINRYGPMMDTNWVVPISSHETLTVFDYYFAPEYANASGPQQGDFIQRSLAASHQVQLEDIQVCESVQRGLSAGVFTGGRYATMEAGEHHFHRLLWHEMTQHLSGDSSGDGPS